MAEEKKKRKINPDKAPGLVKYFYDMSQTQSPSYNRECHQVKILLDKGYTPDQIRLTMKYLYKKKNIDLRWINRTIEEAILENKYWEERNIVNTPAYFVKKFYNECQVKFSRNNFLGNVRKVQMLLDDGFTYDDITKAIEYMKFNRISIFNYISSVIVHDEVAINTPDSGLKYANARIEPETYNEGLQLFVNKTYFDKELSRFEFAFLINLPMNEMLIPIGIKDKEEQGFKCDKMNVKYKKDDFIQWLKSQFNNVGVAYPF